VVKVFLLKNIAKDLARFSTLVEKGFPGYFLCIMFLLVVLVAATLLVMVNLNAKME
jgi:hypothetical protein